jgi:hypothetical protein
VWQLSDWWLEYAYLVSRQPMAINTSPALALPRLPYTGVQGQVQYAARLANIFARYKLMVERYKLSITSV